MPGVSKWQHITKNLARMLHDAVSSKDIICVSGAQNVRTWFADVFSDMYYIKVDLKMTIVLFK